MRNALLIFLVLIASLSFAQKAVTITGRVTNEKSEALSNVNVKVLNTDYSTSTNSDGSYTFTFIPPANALKVSFTLTGFIRQQADLKIDNQSQLIKNIILLADVTQLKSVTINSGQSRYGNMQSIDDGLIKNIPSVSGNFESVLKTLPGVSSNNELSSQYSVRGGNFDENLIYINDIEIFRPLLVRNGQQEGLSFINPELVSKASFSAGGFEARYGEKLSSVLDVRYSRPDSTQLIASAGMLGLSASAKIPLKNAYFLMGFRTKTNQSILKSQPVKGSYQPQFYDFQLLSSVDINNKFNIAGFGDFNLSHFTLIPESRETTFGTINQQYRLRVDYQGQEKDRYESLATAITLTYKPTQNLWFKLISSAFNNHEQETFDIEGSYIFDEVSLDVEGFENVRINRGIGVNYEYARNRLKTSIYSSEIKLFHQAEKYFMESGLRFQYDKFKDRLNEYELIDSAGYILPNTKGDLPVGDAVNAENTVQTNRITAYIQNTFPLTTGLTFSAGLRSNYNTFTKEFLISPRFSAVYRPVDKDIVYRFSAGSYNQPPYYRELRNFNGDLNHQAKSQRSIHLLAGTDYIIKKGGAGLRFTTEMYYKKLNNLTPYTIENLRIRYYADQQSKGYAAGADFSVSKEFVPGLESSFRLSLMKTAEDIEGDSYQVKDANGAVTTINPGYLKRPTDQRVNFSAFFQDKLFNSPSYKVHLTLLYGSALPANAPGENRFIQYFKIPAYKRADIGFSKDFLEGGTRKKLKALSRNFSSVIAYAEVFNLLNIHNTVSYLWIKDVSNNHFAIPNYLTSRQLNIKIIAKIKN
ncbi:MAG: carboxypeptidase-like regulatory domain-containing protein [Sphingobacteriaceae bacterium]|nr:carboxypeptidase-like regulatory domain-containing protein [Sphingobacteriaceae bacterium]